MAARLNPFGAHGTLSSASGTVAYYRLGALRDRGAPDLDRLPYTIRIMVESLLRQAASGGVTEEDVLALANWSPGQAESREYPFMPARVLTQDLTGVPAIVDLAAMRSAVNRLGSDPVKINPLVPVDLVIDHSVQVDVFGTSYAFKTNVEREQSRNLERYQLLKWAQQAFENFQLVPPGTGIVHQVNLEFLSKVVFTRQMNGEVVAYPDSLVGMDSHTTMVNGLGVLGWGVGGIEAEAVMLGQPVYLLTPQIIGVRLTGGLPPGATATDLVLTITQMLRRKGVVGKFLEFTGTGVSRLTTPDRATISNMSPEFGVTATYFPVDSESLRYLRLTGRGRMVELVESYTKEQGLFRTDDMPEPRFDDMVELDLSTVVPSLAGPSRPQDRVSLPEVRNSFWSAYSDRISPRQEEPSTGGTAVATRPGLALDNGSVVIAAITSCTNTSNPSVLIAAGLLAKKAVERGLNSRPWVKTSLAPGSRAVTAYLEDAGLMPYLESLRFHLAGYGCTTCIGNSGPLPGHVAMEVRERDLTVAAVLSGNRNFEGRIHPMVRASYLASPPLVVAYALAGTVDIDLDSEPLGDDPNGEPVYLRDVWPSREEILETMERVVTAEVFERNYANVFEGDEKWRSLEVPAAMLYDWDEGSTYVQEPPFLEDFGMDIPPVRGIRGARVLAVLGDSITTDHISPAGSIPADDPAGRYLIEHGGLAPREFNTFGARRGNHQVMMRGTFGNIRLRNELVPGKEGPWSVYLPDDEVMPLYDAAMKYKAAGTPLLVIGGKEYGSGSSRDWAAKGPKLLGVQAVLVESFERIHRSNLVMMGVLPMEFKRGESRETLGLTGRETYDILGIEEGLTPLKRLTVRVRREDGSEFDFQVVARLDSPIDIEYYSNGGILETVLRQMLK